MHSRMRVYHRYLGFFLAGIMAVYAISGIILIFRDTDFLKEEKVIERQLAPQLTAEALGREMRMRDFKIEKEAGDVVTFKEGTYNKTTGMAVYRTKQLPFLAEKITRLHKANTKTPLFFLNIFFGVSLLFFVVSSFWMFFPNTTVFRKGLYFTLGGVVLTILLLFL
ncbi:PepSY domain-containing protein [Chryseolinea lacunae]|uniref:PepSY domain-containing protein n=1 Tax=Chryseolinea lacunae TaxID=2801331 RepID=A0ABS1KMB6_9BACT|nr:PepSY domain-containing protein [Chryseolinea lacunae]MBL0740609.1 PepSY domain-containing protein [Chryseolinea lacunae]